MLPVTVSAAPLTTEPATCAVVLTTVVATLTPARLLRVDDRLGRLKPGCRADLVHLTDDFQVAEVWSGGRRLVELDAAA